MLAATAMCGTDLLYCAQTRLKHRLMSMQVLSICLRLSCEHSFS